jgi:hypothetical protein
VSIKVMTAVWQHSKARSGDLLVALAIADFSNDDGLAFPAIPTLAKKARLSPRQVKRALQELQRLGELDIHKNRGPHGANRYRLLPGDNMSRDNLSPVTFATGGGDILGKQGVTPMSPNPSEENRQRTVTSAPASRTTRKGGQPTKTEAVWEAYREGYKRRYDIDPIRNAKGNGILARLVDRLGAERAPKVAAYYLGCEDAYYLRELHPTEILLRDCEKLHTRMVTGRRATTPSKSQGKITILPEGEGYGSRLAAITES